MNESSADVRSLHGADRRTCRNCGAIASEAFCAHCGQETVLRLPTLLEFLREAAGRYGAFDGRFWRTMRALLILPGFLTREYLAGRRRRYIRPARLYLFSTLIFFAVSRFFVEPAAVLADEQARNPGEVKTSRNAARDQRTSERIAAMRDKDFDGFYLDNDLSVHVPPGIGRVTTPLENRWEHFNALPRDEKQDHIVAGVLRYGPYAMFALLPAFGFLLKLLYLGRARRYPLRPKLYGEHMVFAAHNRAFLFAMATAMLLFDAGVVRVTRSGCALTCCGRCAPFTADPGSERSRALSGFWCPIRCWSPWQASAC